MHALDFINCSKGISGVNGGQPYCPNLAALGETGLNYLDTSTSKPSDSFPGLMALMTGALVHRSDADTVRNEFPGGQRWPEAY
jgi:hypothetical protein